MPDRAAGPHLIRGSRIGGGPTLEEAREDLVPAPRQRHRYTCPLGHETTVVFHAEAVPPRHWDCVRCPSPAVYQPRPGDPVAEDGPEPRPVGKTHWEQLQGRRTEEELEALLGEALANYRRSGKTF